MNTLDTSNVQPGLSAGDMFMRFILWVSLVLCVLAAPGVYMFGSFISYSNDGWHISTLIKICGTLLLLIVTIVQALFAIQKQNARFREGRLWLPWVVLATWIISGAF